jgi:hypothetical protein
MTSFAIIESAIKDGRTTYKELVERFCLDHPDLSEAIFEKVALKDDDPKILRKKHREELVRQFPQDTESVKQGMKDYDAKISPEKPKRKPPPVRKLTAEEKAYNSAKTIYVNTEIKKMGDDVTLAQVKEKKKELRKTYVTLHPKHVNAEEHVDTESDAESDPQPVPEPVPEHVDTESDAESDSEPVPEPVKPVKVKLSAEEKSEFDSLKATGKANLTKAQKRRFNELLEKKTRQ